LAKPNVLIFQQAPIAEEGEPKIRNFWPTMYAGGTASIPSADLNAANNEVTAAAAAHECWCSRMLLVLLTNAAGATSHECCWCYISWMMLCYMSQMLLLLLLLLARLLAWLLLLLSSYQANQPSLLRVEGHSQPDNKMAPRCSSRGTEAQARKLAH
jgi:hypothetical protein